MCLPESTAFLFTTFLKKKKKKEEVLRQNGLNRCYIYFYLFSFVLRGFIFNKLKFYCFNVVVIIIIFFWLDRSSLFIPRIERTCKYCNLDMVENEYHFLLVCPFYRDLRRKYFKTYYCQWPTINKFDDLMSKKSKPVLNFCTSL